MIKIMKDDNLLQKNEIKRHDYQTRALTTIANKYNVEKNFKGLIIMITEMLLKK